MEIKEIQPFLEYYGKIRQRTKRLLGYVPEEHINWAYKAGKFTIGDQIRHIGALERYMFAENVAGRPSCYSGCGSHYGESLSQAIEFMDRMHGESIAIFSRLSPDDLQRRCTTPGGADMPVWKWLRAMVEHEIHHRGQIYIYLNLLDVATPPMYGLSAEELEANSIKNEL